MFVQLYKPRPELWHFVSRIIVNHFQLNSSQSRPVYPFVPQPEHCLYFYPYDTLISHNCANGKREELPHSILVGPQLSRVDLTFGYNMLVIVVGFHPGGMHRLLQIPMNEMLNTPVDATLLLGREIDAITEQLNEATDYDRMVEIVQLFLLRKVEALKRTLPMEAVLIKMLQQKNIVNVDQLAKIACVSTRQLERQFNERMGIPPKLFARLVRFYRAWMMREKMADISWLKIAHACDYADQMHMIRDFKEFAGITPRILQSDLEHTRIRPVHQENVKIYDVYY